MLDPPRAGPDDATLANQKNVAELSQVRPDARTDKQVDSLVLATRELDAFANLSTVEHYGLARVWTHDQLSGGESLCRINQEQPAYFIVVSGTMEVESQRLSHNLGENGVTPSVVPFNADNCRGGWHGLWPLPAAARVGHGGLLGQGRGMRLRRAPRQ